MYLLKFFVAIYILLAMQLFANGNVASKPKEIKNWKVSSFSNLGTITSVHDKQRNKKVVDLRGDGTKSIYVYSLNKKLNETQILEWSMHYEEDFVILVDLNTTQGKRSFIYTPSTVEGHLNFGLGTAAISSEWKTYRRDLEQDLLVNEPQNRLLSINHFVVKGSGRIDYVHLVKEKKLEVVKVPLKEAKKMVNKVIKQGHKKHSELPKIKILGKNPLMLKRGQEYIEEGAIARDLDGSRLEISMSHNIDSYIDGEYSVIYMATNTLGHTAVDRRVVRIGDFLASSNTRKSQKIEEAEEEEEIEELSLLEQLLPQDKRVQNPNNEAYPSRPGL